MSTIRHAVLTDGETSMMVANDLAVRRALEMAGVEFIDENAGGPGPVCANGHEENNENEWAGYGFKAPKPVGLKSYELRYRL